MTQRIDSQEEELEVRSREILREIVSQYIASGEPISSRSLAKSGRFNLSPASIRNVMADLEDLGYVQQPHTSAGRVPTDLGYRFFINHLMRSRKLSQLERDTIDDQVSQVTELDEVMHISSRLLSKLTDQVGLVFMPTIHQLTMRSIDFIPISETKIVCVIVGTNGVVVNKIVDGIGPFTRDELERIGRYISEEFRGLTLDEMRLRLLRLLDQERAMVDASFKKSITLGIEAVNDAIPTDHDLFVEGTASILNKPEFADAEAMRKTFLVLEEKEKLVAILNRCLSEEGLQILIGSESSFTRNYNFSLVATRYGSARCPIGMVGILGPTRMEYSRMAPVVAYLGRALSRKIEETEQE